MSDDPLRAALAGVRGLLLDLDGVIVARNQLLPGVAEALATLDRRGLPFRIVTNTSATSRVGLAGFGRSLGLTIPPERIVSCLSVSAAWTARRFPGQPLYVLASPDARTEFQGQHLLEHAEAARPGASAAAVVVGDSPADVRYDVLNAAFRLVLGGAALIAMHRNRWWVTPDGPGLDSGAVVAGLEFATGRRARVMGKPAPAFFREGLHELGNGMPAGDVAMVGDDVWSDVLAAQRVGLRGVFVLSGKHGQPELARAAAQARGGGRPTAVAPSLAEVVAALD